MNPDYIKRDCSLPKRCKDLIDVLNLKADQIKPGPLDLKLVPGGDFPQILADLLVPAQATVLELAWLKRKPVQIVLSLMEINVFAHLTDTLDFDTIERLVRRHGYIAKMVG